MRVYCILCAEHVLNTSPDFVCGVPYHGGMFERIKDSVWTGDYFAFGPETVGGDLFCPRCEQSFIREDGALLTEHGLIPKGMVAIDEGVSIVGEQGLLSRSELARPVGEVIGQTNEAPNILACPKCRIPLEANLVADYASCQKCGYTLTKSMEVMAKCLSCGQLCKSEFGRQAHMRHCKGKVE